MLYMQVVRAAEEAASTLAGSIHPEQCIKVLCPIVQTADYPINLAAIKMQSKVVERITKEALHQLLPDIIPGLLQVSIAHVLHFMIKKFISLLPSLWNLISGSQRYLWMSGQVVAYIAYIAELNVPEWRMRLEMGKAFQWLRFVALLLIWPLLTPLDKIGSVLSILG